MPGPEDRWHRSWNFRSRDEGAHAIDGVREAGLSVSFSEVVKFHACLTHFSIERCRVTHRCTGSETHAQGYERLRNAGHIGVEINKTDHLNPLEFIWAPATHPLRCCVVDAAAVQIVSR